MSFAFSGLDHVQLSAPRGCEEAARRFFGELLQLPEIEKPEVLKKRGGVWFQIGPQQLHIGVEDEFTPAKKAHPAFAIQNLDTLRDHLLANGVAVRDDNDLKGAKRFFVDDPWGNRVEFLEWL
ncbi:MAG: VOC family protein [Tumebacillaceae bacterium]